MVRQKGCELLMTQVSTQAELQAAIAAQEPDIQVTADFFIDARQEITYDVTISSAPENRWTLVKEDGFDNYMFEIDGNGSLTLQNIRLDGAKETHTAPVPYGLISVTHGTLILDSGSVLQNNRSQQGGAVYSRTTGTLPVRIVMKGDAVIRDNTAIYEGGGIYVLFNIPESVVELYDQALIENNEAQGRGGGIYYEAEATGAPFTIGDGVRITGNRASEGGGLCTRGVSLGSQAQISGNEAQTAGGGLSWAGTQLHISGVVSNNQSVLNGGGLSLNAYRNTIAAVYGTISENTSGSGGGIYFSTAPDATLDLSKAQIRSNSSTGFGGGCFIVGGSQTAMKQTIRLDHTSFLANRAVRDGGGLALSFYTASMHYELTGLNSEFRDNIAGGNGGGISSRASAGSDMLLEHCEFSNNEAVDSGGGLYAFNQNEESGIRLRYVTLIANTAQQNGGAIALDEGAITADFFPVMMEGNRAVHGNGGGLYSRAEDGGFIHVRSDSQITANSAVSGGGIYHTGPRVLRLSWAKFSQNTAAENGAGVYNSGALELSPLYLEDGLYLENQDAVPTIIQPLTAGELVQLERSGYVTPNPAGDPIVVARADFELTLGPEDADAFRVPASGFDGWGPRVSDSGSEVILEPVYYPIYYQNTKGVLNPNPAEYTVLTPTIVLRPLGSVTGYRFIGWFDAPEGGSEVTEIPLGSTGDKTLYARWERIEHTLTYHGNDAGGTAAQNIPGPQAIYEDQAVPLSDLIPTREGYVFTVWNTRPDGSGSAYQPGASFGPATTDADLYAQWEAIPPTLYLLTYEPNDAGGPSAEGIPAQREIREGETAVLSTAIPTRTGYRFTGWNTQPDGSGTAYQPGQTVGPFYADMAVFAQWQRVEHTLTYHGNDEGGPPAQWIPAPQTIYEDRSVPLSDAVPTREGYLFTGWNTAADGSGAAYQPGAPFGPAFADADLYAQWAALPPVRYLLTYEGNDASGPPAQDIPGQQEVREGDTVELSSVIPTRTGYRFTGWNTEPDGSGTAYQPGQTVGPFYADLTIFAQWQRVEHTLTYHGNDAGGPPAQWIPFPQQVPERQVISLPDVIPTREGYLFAGWNTAADGSGTAYQPGDPFGPIYSDADLYAQWAALPPLMHTLAYYGNDAGGPPAQNIPGPVLVPDGQSVTLSGTIPTREGFAFTGWNTDPSGMGTVYRPGDTISNVRADIDLYAQWVPLPPPCYTLTYCGNDAGGPPACFVPCPQRVQAGLYGQISCCTPYRACYCFIGWNTDPCGRGQTYCPGQMIGPVRGDLCLYAQWRRLPPPKPHHVCWHE